MALKTIHVSDVFGEYLQTADDDLAQVYRKSEADRYIDELKAENERLKEENKKLVFALSEAAQKQGFRNLNIPVSLAQSIEKIAEERGKNRNLQYKLRDTQRAMWLMTAEWADAMGLASCNIANKFMSRENFEVGDDYRNNTVKKYRHRQVVFYKYADYCRQKAEEYK